MFGAQKSNYSADLITILPSSLSDLRLIYYGKAGFGHISRIFSLNSQLFASKTREICLKPVFPSLRSLKSDRLLGYLLQYDQKQ
ncbi:hypothetical protein C1H71_14595 [Iodobacter fluviatilis]|uniref:Uncharacterized protein n=1 Tax=Iodobacter fluviatilis TaxID=537 RepID=A0A7G3GBV9_9NEIS|nr:hypothetical protein C1H71_14595 [Iodobacter fluviatilis]